MEVELKDERVEGVPKGVPMAFEYTSPVYYVRRCYPVYYGQIKELLGSGGKKYISVTGTPGIGKSIFYFYVFNRFREEYSDKAIVTASFTKERDLKKCVVFYPDGTHKLCLDNFGRAYVPMNEEGSIHLYNGPPKVEPPDSQMIAFTSPNEAWLDSIYKAANHCKLYMPVWTFQELSDANELLELGISMELLQQYFGIFGGVARYCLASSRNTVREGLEKQTNALGNIESLDDVRACVNGRKDLDEIVHRLFYYEPVLDEEYGAYYFWSTLRFGSKWIAAKVEERIQDRKQIERADLMRWLDGVGKGGVLYGWLFEQYAHETFQKGGEFALCSLMDDEKKTLNINSQVGHYEKFSTTGRLEKVFEDIYMVPNANNFEALDSFFYSNSEKAVYVFQITRSEVHDVKAYGLMKLLELTGLMEKAVKGIIQLILVFVIPHGLGSKFKKQNIVFEDIPKIDELAKYPISNVKGIGTAKRYKRLREEAGMNTGKELYDAVKRDAPEISFVRNVGIEFVKNVEARSSWDFLGTVPQFYIELKLDQ